MKLKLYVHASWSEIQKKWTFAAFNCNMSSCGYTMLEQIEVDYDPPPDSVLIAGTINVFRAEQDRIRAESQSKVEALQRKIDDMLCIEYKPEA